MHACSHTMLDRAREERERRDRIRRAEEDALVQVCVFVYV